jgi:hypothetical protein
MNKRPSSPSSPSPKRPKLSSSTSTTPVHPSSVPGYRTSEVVCISELPTAGGLRNQGDDVSRVFLEKEQVGSGTGVMLSLPVDDVHSYILAQVVTSKTKVVSKAVRNPLPPPRQPNN